MEKRATVGVACCLVDSGDGAKHLVFDDVTNTSGSTKSPWNHNRLFTSVELDAHQLLADEIPTDRLAEIGFNLLLRLRVLSDQTNR